MAADGQSQPGTSVLAGYIAVPLDESGKKLGGLRRRHSDSCVTDSKYHPFGRLFDSGVRDHCHYPVVGDRKSTRLNSSHLVISYAVFCLKKENSSRWIHAWAWRYGLLTPDAPNTSIAASSVHRRKVRASSGECFFFKAHSPPAGSAPFPSSAPPNT